jgi:hypothetical protein
VLSYGSFYSTEPNFAPPFESLNISTAGPCSPGFGTDNFDSITVANAGTYQITYSAWGQPMEAGTPNIYLQDNGTTIPGSSFAAPDSASMNYAPSGTVVATLAAGDAIRLYTSTGMISEPNGGINTASISFVQVG